MKDNIEIDIIKLVELLWRNKIKVTKVTSIFIIFGIIIAYSIPKQYEVEVILSPESAQNNTSESLSSMASMIGLGNMSNNNDALNLAIYPNIISSTPYILQIYNTKIETEEKEVLTLSEYIKKEKQTWWSYIFAFPQKCITAVKNIFDNKKNSNNKLEKINPYKLNNEQLSLINKIKKRISISIDKKTQIIKISSSFQDPQVSAEIANATTKYLQEYITNYKTHKALEDYNFLKQISKEKKDEYQNALNEYAIYIDSNKNIISEKIKSKTIELQNNINIKYQVYSQIQTQLELARTKIQEKKPAFYIIEPASIPLYPSSPNKTLILLGAIFAGLVSTSVYISLKHKSYFIIPQKKEI